MNEELGQIDADLKGFFVEGDMEEMQILLSEQTADIVSEIAAYNWSIIKKYYEAENFELLFRYLKFVAYTCFIIEYAYEIDLIGEEDYQVMMSTYNDIYERKKQLG